MIEKVLQQLLYKVCLVYLDDVIIFSEDYEDMSERFETRLRSSKLNSKKCSFLRKEIKYYVVSEKEITTDKKKISSVKDWPVPRTKKQV